MYRAIRLIHQGDVCQHHPVLEPPATAFVDVAKYCQLRANLENAFAKRRRTFMLAATDPVAEAVWRAVEQEDVGIFRNQGPFLGELRLVEVERPVEEAQLPGSAVNLQTAEFRRRILQQGPRQAWHQFGSVFADEVVVAPDSHHGHRATAQPGAEFGCQPFDLKEETVVGGGTDIAGDQQQIAGGDFGQEAVQISDRTNPHGDVSAGSGAGNTLVGFNSIWSWSKSAIAANSPASSKTATSC